MRALALLSCFSLVLFLNCADASADSCSAAMLASTAETIEVTVIADEITQRYTFARSASGLDGLSQYRIDLSQNEWSSSLGRVASGQYLKALGEIQVSTGEESCYTSYFCGEFGGTKIAGTAESGGSDLMPCDAANGCGGGSTCEICYPAYATRSLGAFNRYRSEISDKIVIRQEGEHPFTLLLNFDSGDPSEVSSECVSDTENFDHAAWLAQFEETLPVSALELSYLSMYESSNCMISAAPAGEDGMIEECILPYIYSDYGEDTPDMGLPENKGAGDSEASGAEDNQQVRIQQSLRILRHAKRSQNKEQQRLALRKVARNLAASASGISNNQRKEAFEQVAAVARFGQKHSATLKTIKRAIRTLIGFLKSESGNQ